MLCSNLIFLYSKLRKFLVQHGSSKESSFWAGQEEEIWGIYLGYSHRGRDINSPGSPSPHIYRGFLLRVVHPLKEEAVWPILYGGLPILAQLGLEDEVSRMMSLGATFELDRGMVVFSLPRVIRFQLFGEQWSLMHTEFTLLMGLYDTDFTGTP